MEVRIIRFSRRLEQVQAGWTSVRDEYICWSQVLVSILAKFGGQRASVGMDTVLQRDNPYAR